MAGWSTGRSGVDPAASPLRDLVAHFPGAAAHIAGDSLWLNGYAEAVVGYRAEELTTLDEWGMAVHRDHEPDARAVYVAAREAGFPEPVIAKIFHKDGTARLVEFSAYVGGAEEVWVMRDVTDSLHAEQELKDREQRLHVAATTAGLGTWEWHVASDRIEGDAATRRLFGLGDRAGSDPLAAYLARVLPDDRPSLERALNAAIETRSACDVELRVSARHGRSRWLRVHGTVVEDAGDMPLRLIGAVRDIDSYKRLDERLVHAARMESLGQLAGGVAHDFNNLLAVIQGQVEFVLREPGLSEKAVARLESIERAVAKGADMVAELMQLGHADAAHAAVIDVNEFLAASADSLERLVGEDVSLHLHLEATRPFVKFDEARLSATVLNLATNARDAMPVGGLLSITTRDRRRDDGPESNAGDEWLQLTVEDTGVGMDTATRSRIFEPFFTTKAPGVGTGLGLASVYDAVMDAGGVIDVVSTPGSGTTFSISLPCARRSERPAASEAAAPLSAAPGRLVLVVEDDPSILDVTADVLRSAGYRVSEASSPIEALAMIDAGVRPDLVLTDVVMPELSGQRLAAKIQATVPNVPVLYMSGYASAGHGTIAIDDADLIHKPFSHHVLLERVAQRLPAAGPTVR